VSDPAQWLRATIQQDLDIARIIGMGGFEPTRWRGEELNQEQSSALTAAIATVVGADPDDRRDWWSAVYAYTRLPIEPPEADRRTDDMPVLVVSNDRRELHHVMRHDPRAVIADCEAKLANLDLHSAEPGQHPDFCWHDKHELPCPTALLLAWGYRHRDGYPGPEEKS
jgi:hypothetical protein